jgi:hypothetical protein
MGQVLGGSPMTMGGRLLGCKSAGAVACTALLQDDTCGVVRWLNALQSSDVHGLMAIVTAG